MSARYVPITTDVLTGKPVTVRGKVVDDQGLSSLVAVEYRGKVYYLALKDWRDSLYSLPPPGGWRLVGEPSQSRRSAGRQRAAERGKMAPWETRALDAALLRVVGEYGARGATTVLLAEDLFNNHSFSFTRGMAETFGGGPGATASDAASRLDWSKKGQQSAVNSALARLQRAGKVAWAWGVGLRKGTEAKVWTLKEYDR